jgi:hypothetical protein
MCLMVRGTALALSFSCGKKASVGSGSLSEGLSRRRGSFRFRGASVLRCFPVSERARHFVRRRRKTSKVRSDGRLRQLRTGWQCGSKKRRRPGDTARRSMGSRFVDSWKDITMFCDLVRCFALILPFWQWYQTSVSPHVLSRYSL